MEHPELTKLFMPKLKEKVFALPDAVKVYCTSGQVTTKLPLL